jgi:hypothetical protein
MKPALAIAALLILAACGPKGAPAPPPSAPQVSAAPPAPAQPAAPSAPQDAALDPAAAVVRAVYAAAAAPIPDGPGRDPLFTPDLAGALMAHSHPGEPGALDMDYRYGARYVQVAQLAIGPAFATPTGARVTVRFDNIGMHFEIDYDLVQTPLGWRITDVSAPAQHGDGPWSLRAMLERL